MVPIFSEDSDPWLTEYDACEELFRVIMEKITARNKYPKTSRTYGSLSSSVRNLLKTYSKNVDELKAKVNQALRSKTITVEEAERRIRQIEVLQSKDVQLMKLYDARTNSVTNSSANLYTSTASAFADGGTTSWAADDDDDEQLIDIEVSIPDYVEQQNRMLLEQDKGLEELHKVIVRQKEIGHTISNEVNYQNEIISNLADHLDATDESIISKTQQVKTISSKDRTCGYWIVIILLFISIIVVSAI